MIENEKITEIDPMAQLFINRLIDLCDLKDKISQESLPFAYWNEIRIESRLGEPGLEYGIDHALFDAWETLHELGFSMEANAILNFKKGPSGS